MNRTTIASTLDSTNLKLEARPEDIAALCREAVALGVKAVCVYPASVPACASLLNGSGVALAAVVGFPSGRFAVESKRAEIVALASAGAEEVDVVINYPALWEGGGRVRVAEEIAELAAAARDHGMISKFIVETCFLSAEEKRWVLDACVEGRADFIKTSTGFGSAGADLEDVRAWAAARGDAPLKIKASGGIRTLAQVEAFIAAGAERIGLSGAAGVLAEVDGAGPAAGVGSY
jgi:deoxyribose-phosphate aldolase